MVSVDELIKANPDVDPFLIKKWEYIFTMFFGMPYLMGELLKLRVQTLDRNSSHQMDWGDFYLVVRVSRIKLSVETYLFCRKSGTSMVQRVCRYTVIGQEFNFEY